MMIVDLQIAAAGNFQIEPAMFGEELEHVIEKRQASTDARAAIAIQGQLDAYVCLFGFASNQRLTDSGSFFCFHGYLPLTADRSLVATQPKISLSALNNRSFSSGAPTLRRKKSLNI